jgi:hypothetical protein
MAAAEDRVLQYMAENPGASLVDISNVIVAFGADLNTVADMAGIPRAEAQAAFAPTIQPEEDGLDPIEILNYLTGAGPIIGDIANIFSTPTGTYNPTTGAYESPYALNVAGEDTSQETKSASAGSEAAAALGQNVAKKVLDPDSVSIGDIGTNIFNVATGADSDSSDKTKAFFAITDALNSVIPGIGIAARLIGAMDLFGGGRPEATPMTPEERAEYEASTRAELAALGFQEGGEGASEVLLDAILQSAGTNVTAEDLAGILGSVGITADDVGPLYTDQGTAADRGLVETLSLLKAFPAAVDVNFEKDVTQTSSGGGGGEWYDPDTGLVIPDFDPVTGKGMGTLFPVFYPDVTQTSSGSSRWWASSAARRRWRRRLAAASSAGWWRRWWWWCRCC